MVTSSKQVGSPTKQEVSTTDDKISKDSSSSTLSPWSRLKDPRIVRVSRAFGGKDRHSKVCTIRGLRDRRVRFSVPTAIQLYDLQDRLGLNQPSKVVDWLLEAAKQEIDELPPLPIPPGNFSLNHQAMLSSSLGVNISQSNRGGSKMKSNVWDDPAFSLPQPNFWNSDDFSKAKSRELMRNLVDDKQNWTRGNGDDKEETNEVDEGQVFSISALNRASHSSSQGNSVNHSVPFGSFFHLENPNFQLSLIGSSGFSSQTEDLYNLNAMPLPYTLSLSSGSAALVRPPGVTQSYFPSHSAASLEIDPRQISQFQVPAPSTQNLLSSSLAPYPFSIRPFNSSVTTRPLHSPDGGSQPYKEREFPLR